MRSKKAIFLLLISIVSLAACSQNSNDAPSSDPSLSAMGEAQTLMAAEAMQSTAAAVQFAATLETQRRTEIAAQSTSDAQSTEQAYQYAELQMALNTTATLMAANAAATETAYMQNAQATQSAGTATAVAQAMDISRTATAEAVSAASTAVAIEEQMNRERIATEQAQTWEPLKAAASAIFPWLVVLCVVILVIIAAWRLLRVAESRLGVAIVQAPDGRLLVLTHQHRDSKAATTVTDPALMIGGTQVLGDQGNGIVTVHEPLTPTHAAHASRAQALQAAKNWNGHGRKAVITNAFGDQLPPSMRSVSPSVPLLGDGRGPRIEVVEGEVLDERHQRYIQDFNDQLEQ